MKNINIKWKQKHPNYWKDYYLDHKELIKARSREFNRNKAKTISVIEDLKIKKILTINKMNNIRPISNIILERQNQLKKECWLKGAADGLIVGVIIGAAIEALIVYSLYFN